jgi:lipoprotein-anchoring transpeptidase ErfK/SrfK
MRTAIAALHGPLSTVRSAATGTGAVRSAIAVLVLVPLVVAGVGVANVARFNARATVLEQTWSADQAAGVTAAQLAPARTSLRHLRDQRILFLPYSALSGALFGDPFGQPEALAAQAHANALQLMRTRAQDDLSRLQQLGARDSSAHAAQLAAAHQIRDYVRLVQAWETEAAQLDQLSQAAGGLTNGLPKDVVDGVSSLQDVISSATSNQVSTDPAAAALTHAQAYLQLQTPALLAQHDAIANEVKSAGDTVQHRVDTRVRANQLVARYPDLMSQAAKYSIGADVTGQATQGKTDVLAAEQAGDDSKMDAATAELKQAEDRLSGAVTAAQYAAYQAALGNYTQCLPNAPAQLIVIHTSTQKLVAYNNGCPFLVTPVTTGRPAVRTDTGTFTIHSKSVDYTMISPWPSGSPLWYPTTVVHDAMQFNPADGSFIHSADWEPASAYGPGSENGPYASHGCVHVQDAPLATLFNWAQIGATVMIPQEAQG